MRRMSPKPMLQRLRTLRHGELLNNKPPVVHYKQNERGKHETGKARFQRTNLIACPKTMSENSARSSAYEGGKSRRENNGHQKIPAELVKVVEPGRDLVKSAATARPITTLSGNHSRTMQTETTTVCLDNK